MLKALFGNTFAAAGSIFWSVLIQLLSVPLLIKYWGPEGYGTWLMLSAIPVYVALSDLGLGSVATSSMAMSYAKGDLLELNVTFQSVLSFCFAVSICLLTIVSFGLLISRSLSIATGLQRHYWAIQLLTLYACLSVFSTIVLAVFRSAKQYAYGTAIYDLLQFIEGLGVICIAFFGGEFISAACVLLGARFLLILVLINRLKARLPDVKFGFSMFSLNRLKALFRPALGALAVPGALALNIQGMILIAGSLISPMAAAVLGPTRTISRIAIQFVGIINRATVPEFSDAFAKNDTGRLKKLIKINFFAMAIILLPGAVLFAYTGAWLVEFWSGGHVKPEFELVCIMAVAMLLHGCWYFSFNLALAINRHSKMSLAILLSTIITIVVAIALARNFGLNLIAGAILLGEIFSLIAVFKNISVLIGGFGQQSKHPI